MQLVESKKDQLGCELMGSWSVQVGDMDQCIHLWRYTGGFEKIDLAKDILWNDNVSTIYIYILGMFISKFF